MGHGLVDILANKNNLLGSDIEEGLALEMNLSLTSFSLESSKKFSSGPGYGHKNKYNKLFSR